MENGDDRASWQSLVRQQLNNPFPVSLSSVDELQERVVNLMNMEIEVDTGRNVLKCEAKY